MPRNRQEAEYIYGHAKPREITAHKHFGQIKKSLSNSKGRHLSHPSIDEARMHSTVRSLTRGLTGFYHPDGTYQWYSSQARLEPGSLPGWVVQRATAGSRVLCCQRRRWRRARNSARHRQRALALVPALTPRCACRRTPATACGGAGAREEGLQETGRTRRAGRGARGTAPGDGGAPTWRRR